MSYKHITKWHTDQLDTIKQEGVSYCTIDKSDIPGICTAYKTNAGNVAILKYKSKPNALESYYSFESMNDVLSTNSRSHVGNFVGRSAHEAIRKAISAGRQVYTFWNSAELLKHEKIMLSPHKPTPFARKKVINLTICHLLHK